jgi:hypothetical protein
MCEFNSDSNYIPPGSTYMVQRSWSNAAATAGLNPCVPHPVETYFNSYPVFTESVTLNYFGAWTTKGVTIPLNKSGTVDVILSSDAETAPWTVEAFDLNAYITGDPKQANTTVSLDTSTGVNGDTIHLTITVNSSNPMWGGEGFVLQSTLGEQQNLSMGAIVN